MIILINFLKVIDFFQGKPFYALIKFKLFTNKSIINYNFNRLNATKCTYLHRMHKFIIN